MYSFGFSKQVLFLIFFQIHVIFSSKCGRRQGKYIHDYIFGGKSAPRSQWPWLVSLQSRSGNHFCGGALISEQWILTAAHCLFHENGDAMRSDEVQASVRGPGRNTSEVVEIEELTPHQQFRAHGGVSVRWGYDIGFVKLKQRPTNVTPICLPTVSMKTPNNCIVAGWGDTEAGVTTTSADLRYVSVPVIRASVCEREWAEQLDNHTMICAGVTSENQAERRGGCAGDSGGPLMCQVGRKWYAFGIVSFGSETCLLAPGVYKKVQSSLDWIKNITQRLLDMQDAEIERLKLDLKEKESQIVQLKKRLKDVKNSTQDETQVAELRNELELQRQKTYACQQESTKEEILSHFQSQGLVREVFPLCKENLCYWIIKTNINSVSSNPESNIAYNEAWQECSSIGGVRLMHLTLAQYNWFAENLERSKKSGAVPWNFGFCGLYWIGSKYLSNTKWTWVNSPDATTGIPVQSGWQNFTRYILDGHSKPLVGKVATSTSMNLGPWEWAQYKFQVDKTEESKCGYVCEFYS